ncbi:Putative FBD-associated F-box protein [Striga hermonthica]|uniref:FBD-associated F-box protein n=1 Tax=Striga hermonthica TaxID=68872 RepID=A0A9N7MW88_STRHE|nr:Putative FBD-associated F-box protein [Striga hermonthica]
MIERETKGHRGQSLNVFRIHTNDSDRFGMTEFELETMLRGAIGRGVKDVDLYLHRKVNFPKALFECKTLDCLTLRDCTGILDKVDLSKLQKLSFNYVDYEDGYETDEALQKLLAGCPILQELIISGTIKGSMCCTFKTFTIYSATLKKLTMEF